MTSIEDLLRQVEADDALRTVKDKALRLVDVVPPQAYRTALAALALQTLTLRQWRASNVPMLVEEAVKQAAASKSGPKPGTQRKPRTGVAVHCSPKVLAARTAWNDWLATKVPLPGSGERVALRDMRIDQLRSVADGLYDAHMQVHRLAEAVEAAGVITAADLPPEAAQHVLEAA